VPPSDSEDDGRCERSCSCSSCCSSSSGPRSSRPTTARAGYLHTGSKDTLEDVVRFYVTVSSLARTGQLRNGAPELTAMHITESDVAPLAAFLRALNEDYE
jgi:cytochrome c peroxidase